MPISRIYQAVQLQADTTVELDVFASGHLARVLRAEINDPVILFNGQGGEYEGVITRIDKKLVSVHLKKYLSRNVESRLELHLAQGISRGEKMDFVIQKAVELGVKKIFPLLTERCNVKLDLEKREKRLAHWQSIIISACEQSGRNIIPEIVIPETFEKWLSHYPLQQGFVLSPEADKSLKQYSHEHNKPVALLIGPEGGLSEKEITVAKAKGFMPLQLGPRILRTETAAVAALTALQNAWGDF